MEQHIFYIHGSGDSLDTDIHYVFDEMPSYNECKSFCDADLSENRNIITIANGHVTNCYKGTVDEVNNALYDTYKLHEQQYPLQITHKVPRDVYLKYIRATRGILSHLSKSQYRPFIKSALKGTWQEKIEALKQIRFEDVDFSKLNSHIKGEDILKVIAFQIGQSLGLANGVELYTKKDISKEFPELETYLYRKNILENVNFENIQKYLEKFIKLLDKIPYEIIKNSSENLVIFEKTIIYDLTHEYRIKL